MCPWLCFAVFCLLFVSCSSPVRQEAAPLSVDQRPESEAPAPPQEASAQQTILWVGGDVLVGSAHRRAFRDRDRTPRELMAHALRPVSRVWSRDPGAFVLLNMESPVARLRNAHDSFLHTKVGDVRVRAPLNNPAWVLSGMADAGVDGVVLANNHALDQERAGLRETLDACRSAGLVTTGAGNKPNLSAPLVVGSPDARVWIGSYLERDFPESSQLPQGEVGLSILTDGAYDEVRAAKADGLSVVVIVHVVQEVFEGVKPRWRQWAERLATAGADAIVVHGTHAVAPLEVLTVGGRDVPVAWGLGNFLSDMGNAASPSR